MEVEEDTTYGILLARMNYSAQLVKSSHSYIKSLDVNKASGPDGISVRMLKSTARSIAPSLTKLFNISIRLGRFPESWKTSAVVPIPKSSNHKDASNYRPISLLPVL